MELIEKLIKITTEEGVPYFNVNWLLKNMLKFDEKDIREYKEDIKHKHLMEQRIKKINKIRNDIKT
jgi:hypothetical protein